MATTTANLDKIKERNKLLIKQVESTVAMLKFTEFGRHMTKEGFAQIFKQEPMLIYHREIL